MASNANEADEKTEEYESDPDDLPLPAMRRREAASDDEEESDGGEDLPPKKDETLTSRNARSDGESDGQGGAEVYDEDDVDDYDEEEEEYDELGEEFEEELEEENGNGRVEPRQQGELEGENREGNRDESKDEDNKEGEKKENEPYAVPTSGAFYMHDDRFQENGRGGRRRRMHSGGRKIWNPKDERAWVHDRFEEMTIHESRRDDDRRRPRGRYRGRGGSGGRGPRKVGGSGDRGGSYPRGGRGSRTYYDDGQNHNNKSTRSVRGRGQRRYEPVNRNNPRNQPPQEKQMLQKANEQGSNQRATTTTSTNNIRQQSQAQTSNTSSSSLPKKLSSSLNSASPPFYPSNSSNNNQDFSTGTRRDAQNSGPILSDNRGKSIAVGSTLAPNSATTTGRVQGRGVMGNDNQIPSVSSQAPTSMAQHRQAVTGNRQFRPTSLQPSSGTGPAMGDDGVTGGSPINKLKGVVSAPKGKASGTGGLVYGGAQVIGTTGPMSMPHGEPGFSGTPALMPVMPFSGQPHGVPTVGMALPGYVAQSQLGFGNSEMTWVPVLAGAAGSLGGSYCPPYIALDGGYYNNPRPSSQISSSAPAREAGAAKSSDGTKSSQKPEVSTEELGQRQNKPRRYSEMNFGQ